MARPMPTKTAPPRVPARTAIPGTSARCSVASAGSRVRPGLQRMVEEDTYCIDVLTQISAAKSALHAVAVGLLGITSPTASSDAARQGDRTTRSKEASDAIARP